MGCQPNKQLDPNVQNRLRQYYNGQPLVQPQYDNVTPYAFSNTTAAVPAYSATTLQTPSYSNPNYVSANYSTVGVQGSVPAYSAGNYGYAPTQTAALPNYSAGNYGYATAQTAAVPTYAGANYTTDNYAGVNYAPTNYAGPNYAAASYVPQAFPTGNQVMQGFGNTNDLGYQTTLPTGYGQNYQGYGLETNYNQYPQGQVQYVSGNNLQGTGLGLTNHTSVLDNKVNSSPAVELPKGI